MPFAKNVSLTFEDVDAVLSYEAASGALVWKIAPNRHIVPGTEAGAVKTAQPGRFYRYITFNGVSTTAARFVWFLHHKEWVKTVKYKDGDTLNTRIENLELPKFSSVSEMKGNVRVHKMSKEAARHYGLMRYYGITGEQYGEMLAAQKGLCAICAKPETAMINGVPKVMHVDHDHATDKIRALLCGSCNGMLGLAKDDPETLRSAANYIEQHKVVALRAVPSILEGKG